MEVHGDMHLHTANQCCPECGRAFIQEKNGVSYSAHRVSRNGRSVKLTFREGQLFELLFQRFEQVVHRDVMWTSVWGDEAVDPKIVDVYICKLRRKITPLGLDIRTTWGIGKALVFAAPDVSNVANSIQTDATQPEEEAAHGV